MQGELFPDSADDHWFAWAAGIIDGEGCIYAELKSNHGHGYRGIRCRVLVSNTDPRMLLKLKMLFGGRISKPRMGRNSKRPFQLWEVTTSQAEACLNRILPWLIVKKDQAEIALVLRKTINRYGMRGTPSTVRTQQAELVQQIKNLKHERNPGDR